MANKRSMSFREGRAEPASGSDPHMPTVLYDVTRSYSVSGGAPSRAGPPAAEFGIERARSHRSLSCFKSGSGWWSDPEVQRRRRIAQYNSFAAKGSVKLSLRKGLRWLKVRYTQVLYGM